MKHVHTPPDSVVRSGRCTMCGRVVHYVAAIPGKSSGYWKAKATGR